MDGLTGLRGIAALWVVAFHYDIGPFSPLHIGRAVPLVRLGYLGVDLFFILSGFVIWHAHAEDFRNPSLASLKRFVSLRFARLYPVYLFTLLLLLAMLIAAPYLGVLALDPRNFRLHELLIDLAMLQSWGLVRHLGWNYPAWSISAEWFCYLFFPLAALSLARFGRWRLIAALIALLAALSGIYLAVFDKTMNQTLGATALLRALIEFLMGCLLRRIADVLPIDRIRWTVPFLVLLGLAVCSFELGSALASFMPIAIFPVLILAASTRANLIGRIAACRPLVMIGTASYSLYLMQAPVQKSTQPLSDVIARAQPVPSALAVLFYLALLSAATILVHLYVEAPSRRFLRRRIA
jgi:peptidoglycan/LPS O-acetylase OafA/YrhL